MPNLYQIIAEHRRALLAQDAQAAARMTEAYSLVQTGIAEALTRLQGQIATAQAGGETVNRAWLRRQNRLETLLSQVNKEIDTFSTFANREVETAQRVALLLSQQHAANEAQVALPATVWNRVPTDALIDLVGTLGDGSPLVERLRLIAPGRSEAIGQSLIRGLAIGQSPREIARHIKQVADVGLTEALTIARTETLRAYRESSRRAYEANSDLVTGWVWLANLSGRCCVMCAALHGKVFPTSEAMGTHPNCFPAGIAVETPPLVGSTSRWYDGEIVEIETVNGNFLRVTPNHPILTSKGWVKAGLLNKGGDVIRTLNAKSILSIFNPDYDDVPTAIEKVAESFRGTGGTITSTMPTSPEDFHGDGEGSQIHVIKTNRLLRNGINTPLHKPLLQQKFVGRDTKLPQLAGFSTPRFLIRPMLPPPDSIVSGDGSSGVLFRCLVCGNDAIRFGLGTDNDAVLRENSANDTTSNTICPGYNGFGDSALIIGDNSTFVQRDTSQIVISDFDTVFSQNSVNHFVGDTETASHLLSRFAGLIDADEIVKVGRVPFSGHVYNLQTAEGWYIANNIISHNCRCTLAPMLKGVGNPVPETGEEWLNDQIDEVQDVVLGSKAAGNAYRAGQVKLSQFVGKRDDPQWGLTRYAKSLKQAAKV